MNKTDFHSVTEPTLIPLQSIKAGQKLQSLGTDQIAASTPEEDITLTDSTRGRSPKEREETFTEISESPCPSPSSPTRSLSSSSESVAPISVPKDFKLKEVKMASKQEAKVILKLESPSQDRHYQYKFLHKSKHTSIGQATVLIGASPQLDLDIENLTLTLSEAEKMGPDQLLSFIHLPKKTPVGLISGYGLAAYHIAFLLSISRTQPEKLVSFDEIFLTAKKLAIAKEQEWIKARQPLFEKLWASHSGLGEKDKQIKVLPTVNLLNDEECLEMYQKINTFLTKKESVFTSDQKDLINCVANFVAPIKERIYEKFLKQLLEEKEGKKLYCRVANNEGGAYSLPDFLNNCLTEYALYELGMFVVLGQRYQIEYLIYPSDSPATALLLKKVSTLFSSKGNKLNWLPVKFTEVTKPSLEYPSTATKLPSNPACLNIVIQQHMLDFVYQTASELIGKGEPNAAMFLWRRGATYVERIEEQKSFSQNDAKKIRHTEIITGPAPKGSVSFGISGNIYQSFLPPPLISAAPKKDKDKSHNQQGSPTPTK